MGGDDAKKRQQRQAQTSPSMKDGWVNRILLVEPNEGLLRTLKTAVLPNEKKCSVWAMANGFDAITVLEDNLRKGRSVDAVIVDNRPSMSVSDFLDMLAKTMIQTETVVKTITVIPVYNAECEIKKINSEIDRFNDACSKNGVAPRLVISRPKNKYRLYCQFADTVKRALREVEATRIRLENAFSAGGTQSNNDKPGEAEPR